jgi:glycosyltransferase involved in cell wall biosynthesis
MKIGYYLTILPPKMPEAEALTQEITTLRNWFGGELIYLNPNQNSPVYLPRLLFGFHKLKELRAKETNLDLHHLYNPDPFPFPILRRLRRPVIYTISSGVGTKRPSLNFFKSLAAVAVADERSLKRLKSWGLDNVGLVRPGIDTSRFTCSPLSLKSELKLLVGSAPWTLAQFQTKGVDALLAAARQNSHLHLIFLWRGMLAGEMMKRLRQSGLEDRVTVLDQLVDVNQILADVHAGICLAARPGIVKSYPHSLLESLAAGKPVLVSRAIPMADYVESTGCGRVVERVEPADILQAIEGLVCDYESLQKSAQQVGPREFSQQRMIDSYRTLYDQVLTQQ